MVLPAARERITTTAAVAPMKKRRDRHRNNDGLPRIARESPSPPARQTNEEINPSTVWLGAYGKTTGQSGAWLLGNEFSEMPRRPGQYPRQQQAYPVMMMYRDAVKVS